MKGLAATTLLLGAVALSADQRWLYNPRERTAHAVRAWERGDFADAQRALEQALEIAEPDARLEYNAGAGHLAAGTPGAALPLLQRAADRAAGLAPEAWRSLRPDALYNLGNAYLDSNQPLAAADAYRACLRLAPEHQAAKHNLELALRRTAAGERSPQGLPGGPGGEGSPQPGGPGQSEEQGDAARGPDEPAAEGGGQPPGATAGGGPDGAGEREQGQGQRAESRSSRLPSFSPQRDMSAEQAAALLEAVENLEREQRRVQAEEQRRQRARRSTERDW